MSTVGTAVETQGKQVHFAVSPQCYDFLTSYTIQSRLSSLPKRRPLPSSTNRSILPWIWMWIQQSRTRTFVESSTYPFHTIRLFIVVALFRANCSSYCRVYNRRSSSRSPRCWYCLSCCLWSSRSCQSRPEQPHPGGQGRQDWLRYCNCHPWLHEQVVSHCQGTLLSFSAIGVDSWTQKAHAKQQGRHHFQWHPKDHFCIVKSSFRILFRTVWRDVSKSNVTSLELSIPRLPRYFVIVCIHVDREALPRNRSRRIWRLS